MTRIYRYILPHDTGMAPCPEGRFITLATCKPGIRRTAREGDWVLGFRPGSLERGLMLWAGKVSEVVSHGDYQRAHPQRSDAVYRELEDGQYERLLPDYHPTEEQLMRDLSAPVLIFEPATSLYLQGQPVSLPNELAHLAAAGQGYRVNGIQGDDAQTLELWLASLRAKGVGLRRAQEGSARVAPSGCGTKPRRSRTGCL